MAQNVVINGVTYSNVPEVHIPKQGGGTVSFYDTANATARPQQVLSGTTFYADGGETAGEMQNNGDVSNQISGKQEITFIPQGYTSGGTIQIAETEQSKIISDNIKSGVTILGISGKSSVVDTAIQSGAASSNNIVNGYKAYVNGALVEGNATMPTVSQDSVTKVLIIQ